MAERQAPLAVVLPGAPELLTHPLIADWMMVFYAELTQRLQALGYRVELDEDPSHPPNRAAAVWIGHDTGIRRIYRPPAHLRWVNLETAASAEEFPDKEVRRYNQAYFQLSKRDIERLQALAVKDG